MAGILYLVSTPIGNLEDITHRALNILGAVDLIACEDTRHTRKLLNHYAITTRTISYHEHNEEQRARELLAYLEAGARLAIVSDAGTPGVSDPGFRLVRLAINGGITVVPVPGPSALIAALVASGLPTDKFYFGGFLPPRASARRKRLAEVAGIPATLIFYEAPHRIKATLKDASEILGERRAVVARELTKLHEEILRGTLSHLAEHFRDHPVRGEMVLVIDNEGIPTVDQLKPAGVDGRVSDLVSKFEAEGMDHRQALKRAARELGISRGEAYRQLVRERR